MRTTTRRIPARKTAARGRFNRAGPPRRQRARKQQRASSGSLGALAKRLPISGKMLTGLLGAGAAGFAFLRKRRARGAEEPLEPGDPTG
jgi:hypothetical protein